MTRGTEITTLPVIIPVTPKTRIREAQSIMIMRVSIGCVQDSDYSGCVGLLSKRQTSETTRISCMTACTEAHKSIAYIISVPVERMNQLSIP